MSDTLCRVGIAQRDCSLWFRPYCVLSAFLFLLFFRVFGGGVGAARGGGPLGPAIAFGGPCVGGEDTVPPLGAAPAWLLWSMPTASTSEDVIHRAYLCPLL